MRRTAFLLLTMALTGGCVSPDDPGDGTSPIDGALPGPDGGELGFEPGEDGTCLSEETMDTYGLCVCEDFNDVGRLWVERSVEDMPASVGVNGATKFVNLVTVEGSWHGHAGMQAVSASVIEGDVVTTGDYTWVGQQTIGGDLQVGGNVEGVGQITVGGELGVGGETMMLGPADIASKGSYAAPSGPPCACDGEDFFDVAGAVDDAAIANDNDLIGLSDDGFFQVGAAELTLPTGRFYVADVASVGKLHLVVEGQAALYVDGDLLTVGSDQIEILPGGSLDLYVAGRVGTVGQLMTGSEETAASFRLLVGGADAILLNVGQQQFFGHIYAPTADLNVVGQTLIHGSLFVNRVTGVGDLIIRHASAETPPGEVCAPPETPK